MKVSSHYRNDNKVTIKKPIANGKKQIQRTKLIAVTTKINHLGSTPGNNSNGCQLPFTVKWHLPSQLVFNLTTSRQRHFQLS